MPEQPRVYISAAAPDDDFASALAANLAAYGFATTHIPAPLAGPAMQADQREGIATSAWFVVVQSADAASSSLVREELAEAVRLLANGRRGIVAVMRAPTPLPMPPGRSVTIQVVDAISQSYDLVVQQTAAIVLGASGLHDSPAIVPPNHDGAQAVPSPPLVYGLPLPPVAAGPPRGPAPPSAGYPLGAYPTPNAAPQGAYPSPIAYPPGAYPPPVTPRPAGQMARRELLVGGGIIAAGLAVAGSLALLRRLTIGVASSHNSSTTPPQHVPGTLITQLIGHSDKVNAVAWSPDGHHIATASNDGTTRIWSSSGGNATFIYTGHSGPVNSVAWSRDSQRIASASDDTTVRLWSAGGTTTQTFTGHGRSVSAAQWSPDAQRVASCDSGGLRVWESGAGTQDASFMNPGNGFSGCDWSPDGQFIALSSFDRTVRIWSFASRAQTTDFTNHSDRVFSVAWSPDGQFVASAGQGGRVHVWRPSGAEVFVYTGHQNGVQGLAWSPDSRFIASGGGDDTGYGDTSVRVWDAQTGATIAVYTGHARYINGIAWSPDGNQVVSGSDDATAHIWWVR